MKKHLSIIISFLLVIGIAGACIAIFGSDNKEVVNNKPHVHTIVTTNLVEDCNLGGEIIKACTTCNYKEIISVECRDHDLVVFGGAEATCTTNGYLSYEYCKNCKYSYYAMETNALGHDFVFTPGVYATCTEDGYTEQVSCSRCDYVEKSEFISKLGHNITSIPALAPTCTEDGYTASESCSRCDYSIESTSLPALGHDTYTVPAVEATCQKSGHTAYTACTRCDYTNGKTILTGTHKIEKVILVEATCKKEGIYDGICVYGCGTHTGETPIPKTDHSYNGNVCIECGYHKYITITLRNKYNTSENQKFTIENGSSWLDVASDVSAFRIENNRVQILVGSNWCDVTGINDLSSPIVATIFNYTPVSYIIEAGIYKFNPKLDTSKEIYFTDANWTLGLFNINTFMIENTGMVWFLSNDNSSAILYSNNSWVDTNVQMYSSLILPKDYITDNYDAYRWFTENMTKV